MRQIVEGKTAILQFGHGVVDVVHSEVDNRARFSFFQQEVQGFFFFLGGKPKGVPSSEAAPHHAPDFYIDESGLKLGVRALSTLAVEYLISGAKSEPLQE